jgi:glycosyltransferase involved in cell wall biosynthesis
VRVAYFSPLPPERSGIADYSALLLPALRQRIDVEVVRRGSHRLPRGTDVALYHVGNNPDAHSWIVEALRRHRGIVVLHDFVLHHLVAGLTLDRGDSNAYLDAMQRDTGVTGRLIAHGVVDRLLPPVWETRPHEFPLATAVLDYADGVIVHSRYVEQRVRETRYLGPVWHVPHPAWPVPEVKRSSLPREASVVIGCFGNLNGSKRAPQLLRAFAQVSKRHPDALLVLAGGVASRYQLELHAAESGLRLGDSVVHLGFLDEQDIWSLLVACDVLVSLRWPTMGETSGSAIRTLAAGRPLVVSDVGWFSELPDAVAAKVPVDAREVETLAAFLDALASDPELRERMGAAARDYAWQVHDLGHVADLYVAAIEEGAGGPAVRDDVAAELAQAACEVGYDRYSPELSDVAARVREVGLGI